MSGWGCVPISGAASSCDRAADAIRTRSSIATALTAVGESTTCGTSLGQVGLVRTKGATMAGGTLNPAI
jgi:hypothetical protein